MAAKELYDYFSGATVTPDYTGATLSIFARGNIVEETTKNVVIHTGDDGSEERIALSDTSIFFVQIPWSNLSEDDAGTVFDFYHDSSKANGMEKSFYWHHTGEITDDHTYVVRFASNLSRTLQNQNYYGFGTVRLKILGAAGW